MFFVCFWFGSLGQALCERGAQEAEDSDWMWGCEGSNAIGAYRRRLPGGCRFTMLHRSGSVLA